jgi:hypothetical protein
MEFTQIENNEPTIIPAVAEKVYDKLWLSHIRINSTPEKAMVIAHLVPYNGESVLAEPIEDIVIENIFAEMQNPSKPAELRMMYAQVMELLLQTIKAEKEYKATLVVEVPEEEVVDEVIEEEVVIVENPVDEEIPSVII